MSRELVPAMEDDRALSAPYNEDTRQDNWMNDPDYLASGGNEVDFNRLSNVTNYVWHLWDPSWISGYIPIKYRFPTVENRNIIDNSSTVEETIISQETDTNGVVDIHVPEEPIDIAGYRRRSKYIGDHTHMNRRQPHMLFGYQNEHDGFGFGDDVSHTNQLDNIIVPSGAYFSSDYDSPVPFSAPRYNFESTNWNRCVSNAVGTYRYPQIPEFIGQNSSREVQYE